MHESEQVGDAPRVSREPLEPLDEDPAPAAPQVREGLPPGFRMRADAHYVDQLDARMSSIPVRLIDTQAIEATHQTGDAVTPAFIDSVRQLGILQPLLVTAYGSRYRVIAGRRRLAAAVSAGLREVPCLVQHVDGERAERMALASNLPATRPRAATTSAATPPATGGLTSELAEVLASVTACAELMAQASKMSQGVAAALIKAEAARAMDLLVGLQVLRDELPIRRAPASASAVLDLIAHAAATAQPFGDGAIDVRIEPCPAAMTVKGDSGLLVNAVNVLVSATVSLMEAIGPPQTNGSRAVISVRATEDARRVVSFVVRQTTIDLPGAWLARPFEIAWPIRDGASVLSRLQAARKIAHAHGGDIEMEVSDEGSTFTLSIPGSDESLRR
jgi:ParB/RepB/Spo0J family partition protein